MMNRTTSGTALTTVVAVVLTTHAALAQVIAPRPLRSLLTMLELSASASVNAAPDQLVADLTAEATEISPAAAQRRVNALMAKGMTAASAVGGVSARATGYSVGQSDDKHGSWTAQQTLELRGSDGPSLLDLTGRLQQVGFVTASLDWQLSDATRSKAHDAATIAALGELKARARDAAQALGLQVDHLTTVRLDGETFEPRPMRMMAMARMAAPPQATASPEAVSADVSAEVALRP